MQEPGLDRHEWESELESLEPELRDNPSEALPDFAALVGRMLEERGYLDGDGDEREVADAYRNAKEIANRLDAGEDVDPGDVGDAVNALRMVYDHLISERSSP